MNPKDDTQLCLECGLCCNGVLFARGELRPDDDHDRLLMLGLRLSLNQKSKTKNQKFHQPCSALDGCRCQIYSERPVYCRQFECALLKQVKAGQIEPARARRIVKTALERADRVKQLLRELGSADEEKALSLRFQAIRRKLDAGNLGREAAVVFGELTLAVHQLNLLLSEEFYPGREL